MGRMLFTLNTHNNAILREDAIRMEPVFRKLLKEEIQFMILYADYHSKFHQFPQETKLQMAKREIWGSAEKQIPKHLNRAIERYMDLQYDQRQELIKAYQNKIELLKRQLKKEDNPKQIPSIMTAIRQIQVECENLQLEIDTEDEMLDIEGGKKESLLEWMQRNKKLSKRD